MSDRAQSGSRSLASRILVYYALAYVVLIVLMGLFIDQATRRALIEDVESNMGVVARLSAESLPAEASEYDDWAESQFEAGGFRTTLIDSEGVVLGDSHSDPTVMENHSDRPEVVAAISGEVGIARRISASTGFDQLYLALPPQDGLVVRVSIPTRVIDEELNAVRRSILIVSIAIGVAGIAVVGWLARRMARPITELTDQSLSVAGGQLDVSPRRSTVRELDQLGLAISIMAGELGSRISDAERASENLEVVLSAIPEGTILVDAGNVIVYSNPAASDMFGSIPDQLAALAPFQFQEAVREARESGQQVSRLSDHGAPPRRLRATATPLVADGGVLLAVEDITERERSDAVRRDFVANASHELKTPVSTIIAASEAMQIAMDRDDPSVAGFASRIDSSAHQLNSLVADLLDLSRLEKEVPDLSPVRLDLIVLDEIGRIGPQAEAKQLSLNAETTEVWIAGSHGDLAIVVRNLLDNALRYTDEGDLVSVAVCHLDSEALLEVSDTGHGIPTRDLGRVFERFYRIDAGRARATGGTGLGLSIVKHVIESHGGAVDVVSELGVGTRFEVRLPILDEGEAADRN